MEAFASVFPQKRVICLHCRQGGAGLSIRRGDRKYTLGLSDAGDGSAGGIACGGRTVSVGEQDPTGRQAVDIRRHCLRMTSQATDPIVEVIDSDEQHVGS